MHEAAGILLAEMRGAGAAHGEAAVQMHGDHVRPVRPAHAVEDAVAQDAGIVDQDIDAAEGVERRLDDFVGIARLADRQRRGDRFAAGFLDFVDDRLRRAGIGAGAVEAAPISQTTTRAPSCAINSAMPRPMPRAAPVTMATLPATIFGHELYPPRSLSRHARACPAHPDHLTPCPSDRDGRDAPGHDETDDSANSPTPRGRPRRSCAAWPIPRPRRAYCLPRSRRSRIAATGRAGRDR